MGLVFKCLNCSYLWESRKRIGIPFIVYIKNKK